MKKNKRFIYKLGRANLIALLLLVLFSSNLVASAITPGDLQSIIDNTTFYDPNSGCDQTGSTTAPDGTTDNSSCASTCDQGSTTLTGSDSEQQTWNYFKGKGLSDAQTAGVMGNIEQESHFDPEDMQIGGNSKDPYDAKDLGWGIIQWSGNKTNGHSTGDKFHELYNASGLTGPIYELSTQLDLVWDHMQNKPPITAGDFSIPDFEKITDVNQATLYFLAHIEAGTDPNNVRENDAQTILQKYGGSGGGATGSATGGTTATGGCPTTPPGSSTDCTTATGDAKILCEAKKYDGIYYRWNGGHQGYAAFIAGCPDPSNPPNNQPTGSPPDPTDHGLSGNPSPCATDCSGLVSVAVDAAFNLNYLWSVAGSMQGAGGDLWKSIPFSQLAPGDIVTTSEHVEIVDHTNGADIYTFGSPQTGEKTGLHGPTTATDWPGGAWHWTGPGSDG